MNREELNNLSHIIIETSINLHQKLGPGLLEHVYRRALAHDLRKQGLDAKTEVPFRCIYDGVDMGIGFRADVIVENEIIIEIKSTEQNHPIFYKQLMSYLRVTNKKLGLLINFSQDTLIQGLKRIVNKF